MLRIILTSAVLTVLIMLTLHYTFQHMQAMLTVPKVADLVRRPVEKYNEIEQLLRQPAAPVVRPEPKPELKAFLSSLRH